MYRPPSFRLKISDLYREVGDGWASGVTLSDVTADMKEEFDAASAIIDEVGQLIQSIQDGTSSVADILLRDMAANCLRIEYEGTSGTWP